MLETQKLQKGCFDDVVERYCGQKLGDIAFSAGNPSKVIITFPDKTTLTFYSNDLMMVHLSENDITKRRLIPERMPTYDEHYCDVLSAATGSNYVSKGQSFDIWEPFSQSSLDSILHDVRKNGTLDAITPSFGLQQWLTLSFTLPGKKTIRDYLSGMAKPDVAIQLGFKFTRTSAPIALYLGHGQNIEYIP